MYNPPSYYSSGANIHHSSLIPSTSCLPSPPTHPHHRGERGTMVPRTWNTHTHIYIYIHIIYIYILLVLQYMHMGSDPSIPQKPTSRAGPLAMRMPRAAERLSVEAVLIFFSHGGGIYWIYLDVPRSRKWIAIYNWLNPTQMLAWTKHQEFRL